MISLLWRRGGGLLYVVECECASPILCLTVGVDITFTVLLDNQVSHDGFWSSDYSNNQPISRSPEARLRKSILMIIDTNHRVQKSKPHPK